VTIGSIADHGPHRKRLMFAMSNLGALFTILCVTVTPSSWAWGGFLMVIINILYGCTYVLYNAWLPMLAGNTPEVLTAPAETRDSLFQTTMDKISSAGFAYGYTGSVICLIICVGITIASPDSLTAYRVCVLVSGVWWMGFSILTWLWLKPRPGPELPNGASYITLPWKNLARNIYHARSLPQTFGFLLMWFMFSDGFNVISSVGVIYANTSVVWTPLPKSLGLAALLVITPIAAAIGTVFWQWIDNRFKFGAKNIIIVNNVLMALVPAYGLLGIADRSLGYARGWELMIGVIFYGL
jgi:UMF1 family MFS transporter